MRFFAAIAACLALMTAPAMADQVTIGGKQYSTGYHRRPAGDAGVRFYAPSPAALAELPDSYDALDDGRVTPIKNQGNCGSCYAFARAKALEAAKIIAGQGTAETLDVAEQDTLVNDKESFGCDGGFMSGAYETNHGLTSEAQCPYKANDRVKCKSDPVVAKATKWAMVGGSNRAPSVEELKQAIVEHGCLAVTVAAGGGFNPRGGRITTCNSSSVNHMVAICAYRKTPDGQSTEFRIHNSWGTGWGGGSDGETPPGTAWSKQGCNKLASTKGDAALFFYVEGQGPNPPPQPAHLDLPDEIVIRKGGSAFLHVYPEIGVTYEWSTGTPGEMAWAKPDVTTSYTVTAKKADGSTTQQAVKVTVK